MIGKSDSDFLVDISLEECSVTLGYHSGTRSHLRALLVVVVLAMPVAADQPFGERLEVNVTNVDVVVTDRSGARAHGLTRDDFEVIDNGVVQRLTNFSEIRSGAASETAPPATASAPVAAPKRPVTVVLFVDNQHLELKTRARAIEAIQKFLEAHKDDALRVIALRFNGGHNSHPLVGDAATVARELPSFLD